MLREDHARTLSIVRELALGKTLTIDGYTIGMGEDMSIGVVMASQGGETFIGGLSTMDLAQLNRLLTDHKIGIAI